MTGNQLLADFSELKTYAKANNIPTGAQQPTDAQAQQLVSDLVAKGLVPAGTTFTQFQAAATAAVPSLTPAQMAQFKH